MQFPMNDRGPRTGDSNESVENPSAVTPRHQMAHRSGIWDSPVRPSPCRDTLLSSCLIGSPSRMHFKTADIYLPPPTTTSVTFTPTPTPGESEIMKMLRGLKSEVRKLKSAHDQRDSVLQVSRRRSDPPPPPSASPAQQSPKPLTALQKLHRIELMLADTEQKILEISNQLDRTETRINNRPSVLCLDSHARANSNLLDELTNV